MKDRRAEDAHAESESCVVDLISKNRDLSDLDAHYLTDGIGSRAIQGGAISLAAQIVTTVLQFGATMVLARVLVPGDFGLVAMITAVTGFFVLFKDGGLSEATVQRGKITQSQVSSLFWINAGVGGVSTLMVVAVAPLVSWFFGDPRLTNATIVLSTPFLFSSLAVQHKAILRRRMAFPRVAAIHVASTVLGTVVGISLAFGGFGYWSLIGMIIAGAVGDTLLSWLLSAWRPGRPNWSNDLRALLSFGAHLTGSNALVYLSRNLDNLIIGRFFGERSLGLYTKAYSLLLLPIRQISGPAHSALFPALSKLANKPDRFRDAYSRAIETLAFFGNPVVVFLFVCAEDVVSIVLGDQWSGTVPIFRALAPAALMGTTNTAVSWILIPLGRADRQFRLNSVVNAFFVAGLMCGVPFGIMGVAWAVSITRVVAKLPAILYASSGTPITLRDFLEATWRPTVAAILAGGVSTACLAAWFPQGPLLRVSVIAAIFLGCYLLLLAMLPGGRQVLIRLQRLVRAFRASPDPPTDGRNVR